MSDSGSFHLKRIHGRLGDVVYQMTRVQFSQFSGPETWSPSLNVYRCNRCIIVCADLAGVDKGDLELQIQGDRLVLRGTRPAPEPGGTADSPVQVLAMEIDYGNFQREVMLPAEVDGRGATVREENGLIWINLPLQAHA